MSTQLERARSYPTNGTLHSSQGKRKRSQARELSPPLTPLSPSHLQKRHEQLPPAFNPFETEVTNCIKHIQCQYRHLKPGRYPVRHTKYLPLRWFVQLLYYFVSFCSARKFSRSLCRSCTLVVYSLICFYQVHRLTVNFPLVLDKPAIITLFHTQTSHVHQTTMSFSRCSFTSASVTAQH